MKTVIEFEGLAATEMFGRLLGSLLQPGAVVCLNGPLGAGKTHLVRAIAEGLVINIPELVTSPTFGLIHEYTGRCPIYHFDFYRLRTESELHDLGIVEYLSGSGVCLIEWADKFKSFLPDSRLDIHIECCSDTKRTAILTANKVFEDTVLTRLSLAFHPHSGLPTIQ